MYHNFTPVFIFKNVTTYNFRVRSVCREGGIYQNEAPVKDELNSL